MIKVSIFAIRYINFKYMDQILIMKTSESKLDRIAQKARKYDTIVRGFNTTLFITGRIDRMHQ